jgi:two-component sensor histidine kinase
VAPVSTPKEDAALSLTLAVVAASNGPLLLLDETLHVLAASRSFCRAFELGPDDVDGRVLFALGEGEWDVPQFRSLLTHTAAGEASIDAYEFDLKRPGRDTRRLSVNAQLLSYLDLDRTRVLVAIADLTEAIADENDRQALRRENELLLKEVRHRVANSLQIVASVLLQGARRAQSEETRMQLRDAHYRVMSVATLERQLAPSGNDEVNIGSYLSRLCASIGDSMISDPARIALQVNSDDVMIPANRSVCLGLITTELVINSLKHGFPDGRTGTITVSYTNQDESWSLAVVDDGLGMPRESGAVTPGLGSSIVQALARQLDAAISVADAAPGARVSVTHAVAHHLGEPAAETT